MKANKLVIIWSGVLMVLSLITAVICRIREWIFYTDIYVGVFSSTLLSLIIAIINYYVDRRRTLERFYIHALKAIRNFERYEYNGDLEKTIDVLFDINSFDYYELDMALGEMDFLFNSKTTQKYIYFSIYKPILDLRKLISKRCIDFKIYRDAENGNKQVMERFVKEIDREIMCREIRHDIIDEDGIEITVNYNVFVNRIRNELYGKYYRIMYLGKHGQLV